MDVFSALIKTLKLFDEKRFWYIIKRIFLATTALFIGLALLVWLVLAQVTLFDIRWVEIVVDVLGGLSVLVLTWLLFPAVSSIVASFFLEQIVEVVETRDYPGLPTPLSLSLSQNLLVALQFTGITLFLNLLILPLYLVPGLNLFLFYGVNGYLLSREYFELVALRRLTPRAAKTLRKAHQARLFLAGVLITFLLTIPLVNLIAPLLATAFMVHIFEGLRRISARHTS